VTKHIFSPYRICPIGAHVDHQGGPVLGRTINMGTRLAYSPLDSKGIHIESAQLGETRFFIGDEIDRMHWARYAQAAAIVLDKKHNLRRGFMGQLNGTLIGAGLSSSASVSLAYLRALADVNDIELSNERLVQMEYELEHDLLGLHIGFLDPLTIVYGKRNALLFMDTITASVKPVFDSPSNDSAWILAYSGVSRDLSKSGFNRRVLECRQAASLLKDGAQILCDVPRDLFEEKKMTLPNDLRRRAEHFYSEVERVRQGATAWENSDMELFGTLMDRSCESSIRLYESGTEILIQLHEIVSDSNGIYGSRFSGGGYGGCVVALAERGLAENAALEISEKFSACHPELPSAVHVVETSEGLR
jgi:galactokinase/galacturonokinase